MRFHLVQTGETVWEVQQRIDSLAGAPLSEAGRESIRRVAEELVPLVPAAVYAGNGESERETAELLAKRLDRKVVMDVRLGELDFGLWQGLTVAEIRHRQPKLHRQWTEAPGSVRPPGGESLQELQQRLREAFRQIGRTKRKKIPASGAVVVLRPVALGAARCLLEKAELDEIWKFVGRDFTWRTYEIRETDF